MVVKARGLTAPSRSKDRTDANDGRTQYRANGTRKRVDGNCCGDEEADARTSGGREELRGGEPPPAACDGDGGDRSQETANDAANSEAKLASNVTDDRADGTPQAAEHAAHEEEKQSRHDGIPHASVAPATE